MVDILIYSNKNDQIKINTLFQGLNWNTLVFKDQIDKLCNLSETKPVIYSTIFKVS